MSDLYDALRTLTEQADGEPPEHGWFFGDTNEEMRATISHLSGVSDGDEMDEFIHRLEESGDLLIDEDGHYIWYVHSGEPK